MCKTAATITVTKGLPSSDRVHRLSPPLYFSVQWCWIQGKRSGCWIGLLRYFLGPWGKISNQENEWQTELATWAVARTEKVHSVTNSKHPVTSATSIKLLPAHGRDWAVFLTDCMGLGEEGRKWGPAYLWESCPSRRHLLVTGRLGCH